nr:glycerophosphodiester phosphodiesterase family protein [Candidatus Sigynarchaeum springense]
MVLVIAHRGFSGKYPENTMLAFRKAIEIGAGGIELDVHATSDGHIVVMHDGDVRRTTNGSGLISKMTLGEFQKLDAGQGEHPPLLEDVIVLCKEHGTFLNIEIKALGIQERVARLVMKHDYVGNVLISSFMHPQLPKFKTYEPNFKIAALIPDVAAKMIMKIISKLIPVDAINPHYKSISNDFMAAARARKYSIYAWTVDDVGEFKKLASMGVAGVITNRPDLMIGAEIG